MKKSAVIVGEGARCFGPEKVIRWEEYTSSSDEISLPTRVEDEADLLREEYLTWVHEMNMTYVGGKTLAERLVLDPGVSAWWSATLVEKSLYKTPEIYDILRLRALERCLEKDGIEALALAIPNRRLNEILKAWCRGAGIAYEWRGENIRQKTSFKDLLQRWLPTPVQAALFLVRFLWQNRFFLVGKTPAYNHGLAPDGLTFFSYFDNLDKKSVETGRFGSHYWAGLPNLLGREKRPINWVFRFTPSALCPDPKTALRLRQSFDLHGQSSQRFFFLEQWLSWAVVVRAVLIYWSVIWNKPSENAIRSIFQLRDSRINFWPLLIRSWRKDMSGSGGMENALTTSLFSEFARKIPKQALGVCLAEHQGWERVLIQYWRRQGHGRIVGFAHATIRFFDLAYFECEATYHSKYLPRYDSLLVCGRYALDMLLKAGYPPQELVKVEALRYLYLTDLKQRRSKNVRTGDTHKKLLVLTDYEKSVSLHQIKILGRSIKKGVCNGSLSVTIKPHPNFDIRQIASTYLPAGGYKITDAPLSELLPDADVAYTSNFTSASLETAYSNLPTAIALPANHINMSPLLGVSGVVFVKDASGLIEALDKAKVIDLPADYFYLDNDLRLWRNFLVC